MSVSNQPSGAFASVRARKARSARLRTLARAVVETLERRQLLSVTGATITAASSQVNEGTSVALTLAASTDDGDGTTWNVDPGDGSGPGGPIYVAAGYTGEFDYTFPGDEGATYHVTAQVYDEGCCGAGGSDSPYDATPADLTITDAPITFDTSGGDAFATEGDSVDTITLGTIDDQGSDPSPDPEYQGTIDWGDGNSSAAIFDGTTVEGTHAYTDEGTFTASVNIQDDGGSTASGQVTVDVADPPISVSAQAPANVVVGQAFTNAVVGTITDPNQAAPTGDFTGTIDWGDGPNGTDGTDVSTATFQPVAGQPGTFNILGSHTYTSFGTFTMAITAQDDQQSPLTADATVSLTAPTITVGGVLLGPGEILEVPVSLSGDSIANQPLTIVGYDSSVIQAAWESGSTTDATGNANLLVTGVDVGESDIVVALATAVNVQGAGPQQVAPNNIVISPNSIDICSAWSPATLKTVTAKVTHPDTTPAPGRTLTAQDSDHFHLRQVDRFDTDANGNETFTIIPDHVTEDGCDLLTIYDMVSPSSSGSAAVTVVPPTITMPSTGSLYYTTDNNGNLVPSQNTLTATITDPTLNNAPIEGVTLHINLPNGVDTPNTTVQSDQNGIARFTVLPVQGQIQPGRQFTVNVDDVLLGDFSNNCTLTTVQNPNIA